MNMPSARQAQVVIPSSDLAAAIAFYTDMLGFRLDMIMPADAPRVAVVSACGLSLRLEQASPAHPTLPLALRITGDATWLAGFDTRELEAPDGVRVLLLDGNEHAPPGSVVDPDATPAFLVTRAHDREQEAGRAGMLYRDLIPGRLGGRYIASHIAIPDGGPVPDYVHYHRVRFQMIYCLRGWVRVVYEDQGDPFVMHAGDCVLQPPTIRHRVLEASPGLEVVEIGGPAEHETLREHGFGLPTTHVHPERDFGGQRFVRHVAARARWEGCDGSGFRYRDTGIADATGGLARVRVVRAMADALPATLAAQVEVGAVRFLAVLDGGVRLQAGPHGEHRLAAGDACVLPPGSSYALDATGACEVLDATLPWDLQERDVQQGDVPPMV